MRGHENVEIFKLKSQANNFNMTQMITFLFDRKENIVEKGANAAFARNVYKRLLPQGQHCGLRLKSTYSCLLIWGTQTPFLQKEAKVLEKPFKLSWISLSLVFEKFQQTTCQNLI